MSTFILSDESINDRGYRILTGGIDVSRFQKNPVMLWMHRRDSDFNFSSVLPIGRWDNIRVEDGKLMADPVFDDNDKFSQLIKTKVENGFLNAASIGIDIKKFTADKEFILDGQERPTVTECELYEASIVDIPANKNAVQLMSGTTEDRLPLLESLIIPKNIIIQNEMNKYEKLTRTLGWDSLEFEADGRRTFTVEEMAAIELALAALPAEVENDTEALAAEIQAKMAEIETLKETLAERDEQINNLLSAPPAEPREPIRATDTHSPENRDELSKEDIELYYKIKR